MGLFFCSFVSVNVVFVVFEEQKTQETVTGILVVINRAAKCMGDRGATEAKTIKATTETLPIIL